MWLIFLSKWLPDSSVPRVTEPIPQSSLVEPSHLRAEDANSESRGSAHVSGHSSLPSFTKMAPLTVPLTQRFPETSSVASQLTIGDQAQPMTASEQIMTELQSSTPSLFRYHNAVCGHNYCHLKPIRVSVWNKGIPFQWCHTQTGQRQKWKFYRDKTFYK